MLSETGGDGVGKLPWALALGEPLGSESCWEGSSCEKCYHCRVASGNSEVSSRFEGNQAGLSSPIAHHVATEYDGDEWMSTIRQAIDFAQSDQSEFDLDIFVCTSIF
jgi:hypothetical protein